MKKNFNNTMAHTHYRLALVAGIVCSFVFGGSTAADAATYTTVDVRLVASNETIYDETVYVSSDGCVVSDDAGIEYTITGDMAICALDLAATYAELEYGLTYYDGFGFLLNSMGDYTADSSNYWLYYINDQMPSVGLGDYDLVEGDTLLLTFGGYNPPLRLSLSHSHRRVDGQIVGTVETYVTDYTTGIGAYSPVLGATVHVEDTSYTTDESGRATFTLGSAGRVNVTAESVGYTTTSTTEVRAYKTYRRVASVGRDGRSEFVKDALAYLSDRVDESGMVDGSMTVSEWAAMAYAAAGAENDALFTAVKDYRPTAEDGTSELARHILALEAIGIDSRNFQDANFVERLKNTIENGQFGSENYCNDDMFAVLALISADEPIDSEAIRGGAAQTLNCFTQEGGVSYAVGGSVDNDTTAAWLMMASRLKGKKDQHGLSLKPYRQQVSAYLRSVQRPDGGWGYDDQSGSNSSSTAWILQGLRSARHEAKAMTTNSRNGFNFLSSVQGDSGVVHYDIDESASLETLNTAYSIMAFERRPLPVNKKAKLKILAAQ